jgi:Tol biopolymer transport system component
MRPQGILLLAGGMLAVAAAAASIYHFTRSSIDASEPAWSPDGKMIAYRYGDTGGQMDYYSSAREIRVMRADGTHEVTLADRGQAYGLGRPDWSPDGRTIAFSGEHGLYLMKADGSGIHRILREDDASEPDWSPDGKLIAFSDLHGISVIRPDGTGRHRVTSAGDDFPDWSPDGKRLVVGSLGEVDVIDANGRGRRVLVGFNGLYPDEPAWSPDGTRIAVVEERQRESGATEWDLLVLFVRNGRRVTVRSCDACDDPAWSPDGARIAFDEKGRIASVRTDGSGYARLAG